MTLGYTDPLLILAFDHRGSFQTKLLGIPGTPTPAEVERIEAAKRLIYSGFEAAVAAAQPAGAGILVDEQFGAGIARSAH